MPMYLEMWNAGTVPAFHVDAESWISMVEKKIKGMDLSSVPQVEAGGGRFFCDWIQTNPEETLGQNQGTGSLSTPLDPVYILREHGMNLMRLRLWNDPKSPEGEPYGGGNTDLSCVMQMAKRARSLGIPWLLDFHYSDCWADPGKQIPPKAWQKMGLAELEQAVYRYTKEVLRTLAAEELLPQMVQPGNELTNGLLWPIGKVDAFSEEESSDLLNVTAEDPSGMRNAVRLINAGIRAVREAAPEAEIMIHLDNGGNAALYRNWFDKYFAAGGEDFDIIGLSYYPFWHGTLSDLQANMKDLALRYKKDMIVAETSMGFTLEDYQKYEQLPTEKRNGMATKPELAAKVPYPMTPEGQSDFMRDLMKVIADVPEDRGRGFIYWEPGLLPVPGTDWATPAGIAYMREKGAGGNEWANQALFDYEGHALPALRTIRQWKEK